MPRIDTTTAATPEVKQDRQQHDERARHREHAKCRHPGAPRTACRPARAPASQTVHHPRDTPLSPILGLALGHSLASTLGHAARWVGAGLLIATGGYGLLQALRTGAAGASGPPAAQHPGRLLVTGIALSIDNLAVGFALGTYHVSLVLAAAVIGTVSVAMSLAGLELGARIGLRAGQRGEFLGGLVLIGVGVAIGTGVI